VFAANAANTGGDAFDRSLERFWQFQELSRPRVENRRNIAGKLPLTLLP
jgi:hypothetical protein